MDCQTRSDPCDRHGHEHDDDDDDGHDLDAENHSTHHCHECHSNVRPLSMVSPLTCPLCNGGFLEEISDATPPSSPDQIYDYMGRFGHVLDDISAFLARRNVVASTVNPFLLFQDHLQTSLLHGSDSDSGNDGDGDGDDGDESNDGEDSIHGLDDGSSIRNTSELGFAHRDRRRVSLGYGIRHLIHQISQQYDMPNTCHASPPASASSIDRLRTIIVFSDSNDQHHGSSSSATQCPICKDEFEPLAEAKQMPCTHVYHSDCLLPWLARHNSCPVCRFELPTDDPEYEQVRTPRVPPRRSHERNHVHDEGSSST